MKTRSGKATIGKPDSQPAMRGPCRRSTMPNTSRAKGTMVSFRSSKSVPRSPHGDEKTRVRQWCNATSLAEADKSAESFFKGKVLDHDQGFHCRHFSRDPFVFG